MAGRNADIIIYGGGIAGLWTLARLKKLGYDVLLVEPNGIGGIQTIASQGIIHSGLKYKLGRKISPIARAIGAMPSIWHAAINGDGPVDLRKAKVAAESQYLMIPGGVTGRILKIGAKRLLGNEVKKTKWPAEISASGFDGALIEMGEPVLDIPSVVQALAEPHMHCIRKSADGIKAKKYIYTAAGGNDDSGIGTQRRPLLMGLMKNMPFPLWAHFFDLSEKPVATVTTHRTQDEKNIWYFGGQVAERLKNADPTDVYDAMQRAIKKYLPLVKINNAEFSVFPVDRVEPRTRPGIMPDSPVLYNKEEKLYAWPTKLTFAPLMADKIAAQLMQDNILPSHNYTDWSFLPEVSYAQPPWETAQWTSEKSAKQA